MGMGKPAVFPNRWCRYSYSNGLWPTVAYRVLVPLSRVVWGLFLVMWVHHLLFDPIYGVVYTLTNTASRMPSCSQFLLINGVCMVVNFFYFASRLLTFEHSLLCLWSTIIKILVQNPCLQCGDSPIEFFSCTVNVLFLSSSFSFRSNTALWSAALDDNMKPDDKRIDNIDKDSWIALQKMIWSGHCTNYPKDCNPAEWI